MFEDDAMAFHVKDDFQPGAPISSIGVSWFNAVASFLNNLVGGFGIKVRKNDSGASTVELDTGAMSDTGFAYDPNTVLTTKAAWAAAAPKDVALHISNETDSQKIARVGKSNIAAPIDHVHRLPGNFAPVSHNHSSTDITVGSTSGGGSLHLNTLLSDISEYDSTNDKFMVKPAANGSGTSVGGVNLSYNSTDTNSGTAYDFHATASSRQYVTLYVACRSGQDGTTGNLYFRPLTISPDGRVVSLGAEIAAAMAFADAAQVQ